MYDALTEILVVRPRIALSKKDAVSAPELSGPHRTLRHVSGLAVACDEVAAVGHDAKLSRESLLSGRTGTTCRQSAISAIV